MNPIETGLDPKNLSLPATIPRGPSPGSEVRAVASLDYARIGIIVNNELATIERMESLLTRLEAAMMSQEDINSLTILQRTTLYQMAHERKKVSAKFMIDLMDLGVRAKFLEKMLTPPAATEPTILDVPVSKEQRKVQSLIREIIDKKVQEPDEHS